MWIEGKEIRNDDLEGWVGAEGPVVVVLNGMGELKNMWYTIPYLQVTWLSSDIRDFTLV